MQDPQTSRFETTTAQFKGAMNKRVQGLPYSIICWSTGSFTCLGASSHFLQLLPVTLLNHLVFSSIGLWLATSFLGMIDRKHIHKPPCFTENTFTRVLVKVLDISASLKKTFVWDFVKYHPYGITFSIGIHNKYPPVWRKRLHNFLLSSSARISAASMNNVTKRADVTKCPNPLKYEIYRKD